MPPQANRLTPVESSPPAPAIDGKPMVLQNLYALDKLSEVRKNDMRFALGVAEDLTASRASSRTASLIFRQVLSDIVGVPVEDLMRRFSVVPPRPYCVPPDTNHD